MPMTPKEMLRYLQKNGFRKADGGKGGHQKMVNPTTKAVTYVPMHSNELGRGIEHKILREAKLK